MGLSPKDLIEIYRVMLLTRRFEEKTLELAGLGWGRPHTALGQEAIAGAYYNLPKEVLIQPYHRGRPTLFALGVTLKQYMLDYFGKEGSTTGGKHNYLHLLAPGVLPKTGIQGQSAIVAAGASLATKLRKTGQILITEIGDGGSNQGDMFSAFNFAAIWNLPIVFLAVNNEIAFTVPLSQAMAVDNIADRCAGFGFRGVTVDGNDVLAVYEAVQESMMRVQKGEGPMLVECKVTRLSPHVYSSPETRSREVMDHLWSIEPVGRFEKTLVEKGVLTKEMITKMDNEIKEEINVAVRFAEKAPYPPKEEALRDLYKVCPIEKQVEIDPITRSQTTITFREAANQAIREEMERDDDVFYIGQDVEPRSLSDVFGTERVRNTPLCESGMVGIGIGAAILGMRPIVEISSINWMTIAFDQIVNSASKMFYATGGQYAVPMVVRTRCGASVGADPFHSQSLEASYIHYSGLRVVMPSTPYDVKGLLKTSIRSDNPVIFIEHTHLNRVSGVIPEGEYTIPFGKASVKREGDDVTVVATALMVHKALSAANSLNKEGISVEVIDPRTLAPLDKVTIIDSVKKTGKAVITHEAWKMGGVGAEIAAVIAEEAGACLEAPIKRVAGPDCPFPHSKALGEYWLSFVSEEAIMKQVRSIIR
jgi:2-oxoisovalerate dehydrogenase E1 component